MNFNDDDSILYPDDSMLRPPPTGAFLPGFPHTSPNVGPGSPSGGLPSFPGGPPMGGHTNIGPPPKTTPSKTDANVQKLSSSSGGPTTKAVSPGSISFCLFRFTYIWETNGRNYWAFLLNVDRQTASGLRWFRNNWVYFGVDLKRIDSFICYRNDLVSEDNLRGSSSCKFLKNTKKEYSYDGVKNIYTRILTSVEVPEMKDDFIINYLGEIDGNEITSKIPCKQTRITNYRIVLELTYPEKFNEQLIDKINSCAVKASTEATKHLNEFRDSKEFLTPLEIFESSTKQIGKSFKTFSYEFNDELKKSKISRDLIKEIRYIILQEKIEEPWRII